MHSNNLFSKLPLGRNLAILTKDYYGALSKKLEHLEIDKQYSVLIFIEQHPQNCTQQFISDSLKIDKASMVNVIDYFVKKKFLKRTTNINDRREHHIELTSKAISILPELHEKISELNNEALSGLSKSEIEVFEKAICTICTNLNKLPSSKIIINYKKQKIKK